MNYQVFLNVNGVFVFSANRIMENVLVSPMRFFFDPHHYKLQLVKLSKWDAMGIISVCTVYYCKIQILKIVNCNQGPISSIKFVRHILNCAYVVF